MNKKKSSRASRRFAPDAEVAWASNGLGLAVLSNEIALRLTIIPEDEWTTIAPADGTGDIIMLTEHEGVPVLNYVRGSDQRCLLGSPVHRSGDPGADELLEACREISEGADGTERQAKAEGWWEAIDPLRRSAKA